MKKIFAISFLLLGLASAAQANSFEGRWSSEMVTPKVAIEILFEFQTDGRTPTNAVATPIGVFPLTEGVVNGNSHSIKRNFTTLFVGENGEIIIERADG